jgi:membrane-associated phospholipid phosphatase
LKKRFSQSAIIVRCLQQSESMISWLTVTRVAGMAVTAPVALAIAAFLVVEGERRLALLWCVLFAAGLSLVVVTKMAFIGWGIGFGPFDFTGASGHTMRATAVAPVLLYLLLNKAPPPMRLIGILAGLAFGMLIGVSRLALHAHSVSEVVAGWWVGALVSLGFICLAGPLQKPVLNPARIAGGMVALVLLAGFARPFHTQAWLTKASLLIAGHDKPFIRSGPKPVQTKAIGN